MSMNSKSIAEAIKERRSIRNLKKPENLTKEKVEEILKVALYTPSAFGMQSARMVVLTEDENKKFWELAKTEVKKTMPAGQDFRPTEDKLNGFAANFPVWAEQANGMLQYAVWLLLHTEGLAASLQHYNPLVDASVKQEWNIPDTWRLRAQMPFGLADETPGDRSFLDFGEVVKFY